MGNLFKKCENSNTKDENKSHNQYDKFRDSPDIEEGMSREMQPVRFIVERIYTIKINLSKEVATFLMYSLYSRLKIPVEEVRVLISAHHHTVFMIRDEKLKKQLISELSKSDIKYTD